MDFERSESAPVSHPGEPPWEIALLFPTQGNWSEDEYLSLHTNRMVELANGCLEVLPMPTILHQLIVQFLYEQLKAHITTTAGGLVLLAPLPVKLFDGTYREPDIVYLGPNRSYDRSRYPHGADLVMEVVSEGADARRRDLETKREDYAAAAIGEYWIVDPQQRSISELHLVGRAYSVAGEYRSGGEARSVLLNGFQAAVQEVFAAAEE